MSNIKANTKIFPIQSQIINWFIPAKERHYFVTISKLSIPTILLFFQNNGYGPRVEDECHEEDREGQPKVDGVWNLIIRIILVWSQLIWDVLWMVPTPYQLPQNHVRTWLLVSSKSCNRLLKRYWNWQKNLVDKCSLNWQNGKVGCGKIYFSSSRCW